jgi:hypothetical protein
LGRNSQIDSLKIINLLFIASFFLTKLLTIFRCKKCKFSCTEERGQLEHQRKEHPGGLEMASSSNSGRDRTYCVSLAFDVLLDTLKCCFPLDQIGQTPNSSGNVQPSEKVKTGKKATTSGTVEVSKKRRGRKRKHKDSTGTSSGDDGTEIVLLNDEEEEEECSWTEED